MVLNALASITKGKNIDKKAKQKIFFLSKKSTVLLSIFLNTTKSAVYVL